MPHFEKLDVSDNHGLHGSHLTSILDCFPAGTIKALDLSGTSVEDEKSVIKAIMRHNSTLRYLNLSHSAASSSVLASLVGALSKSGTLTVNSQHRQSPHENSSTESILRELDIRGNYLDVQVISILTNALEASTNSSEVVHMGGRSPDHIIVQFRNRRKLVDFRDVQNHLTHHRFGVTSYRVGKLSLERMPLTNSTSSPPCHAKVYVSALLDSFEPALFGLELAEVLGLSAFGTFMSSFNASVDGYLSLSVEVLGVPSLTLGDVNANRSVVTRLVRMVMSMDPDAWRLRIIGITMIKREMVDTNLSNPQIIDHLPKAQTLHLEGRLHLAYLNGCRLLMNRGCKCCST